MKLDSACGTDNCAHGTGLKNDIDLFLKNIVCFTVLILLSVNIVNNVFLLVCLF